MTDKSKIIDPFYQREAKRYKSPIASREFILKLLNKSRGLNLRQIEKKLNYTAPDKCSALKHRVGAMERDGQIVQTSAQKYIAISRLKRVEGTYHRRRDGSACLLYQGDQIHISGFSTQIAMEGDNVEAALYNGIHNVDMR